MIYCVDIVQDATLTYHFMAQCTMKHWLLLSHSIVIANAVSSHFDMSSPNWSASDKINTDINRGMNYDTLELAVTVSYNVPKLNNEWKTFTTSLCCQFRQWKKDYFYFGCARWYWQNIPNFATSCWNTLAQKYLLEALDRILKVIKKQR